MVGKKDLIRKLKAFREELGSEFPVERLILFGSMATGKAGKDSDVDLMIVSPKFSGMGFFSRGASMYNHWNIRMPVDFLCYTPQEFSRLSKRVSIVKEANETGIEI